MKNLSLLLIALFTLGGLRAQLFEQAQTGGEVKKPAPKPTYDYNIPADVVWIAERKYGCKIGYYENKAKKEFLIYAYLVNSTTNAVMEYELIQIPLDKSKPVLPNFKVTKDPSENESYLKWTGSNSYITTKILTNHGEVMEQNNTSYVLMAFALADSQKAQELADKLNAAVSNVK